MCFPEGSLPPPAPGVARAFDASATVVGAGRAHLAAATGAPAPVAAVVLHDGRGMHRYYERLAECLAGAGVDALAIDLYGRTAGVGERGPEFASHEHSAQLRWASVQDDLAAAVARLRGEDERRPVITVGFCLGGRISLLAATVASLRLAGAVAFYGQTHGPTRSDLPAPDELTASLTAPVLSIFGGADELVSPAEVQLWREAVAGSPSPAEVVVYPGAPHSFFDREAAQHADACADAWARVLAFAAQVSR